MAAHNPPGSALLGVGHAGDTHSRMHGRNLKVGENPLAYGAVGNGVADDTTAVQEAIDAASTAGGGVVVIPSGYTFLCSELTPKSNVNIIGQGWGSILKLKNGANPVGLIHSLYTNPAVDNVRIANLQIDGNKANNTAGSGIIFGGQNIVVENCYVHDTAAGGIVLGRPTGGGKQRIINNWVHNPALSGNFWGALSFTGGELCIMHGNMATSDDGFAAYGLNVEPNADWHVDHAVISNNIATNCRLVITGPGTIDQATVVGNLIDADPNAGAGAGLQVEDVTGATVIANNQVKGMNHTSPVMLLDQLTSPQVTGNRLTGMGSLQDVYTNNVGILLLNVTGGTIAMNQIIADSPTHATENAGVKTAITSGVTYVGNRMKNVTVTGIQQGWHSDDTFDSNQGIKIGGNLFVDAPRNVLANSIKDPSGAFTIATLVNNVMRMADATNIEFNATTGTMLGTGGTQKLAFWGATPIAQPGANADTSGATLGQLETEVNQLKATLRTLGLMAP